LTTLYFHKHFHHQKTTRMKKEFLCAIVMLAMLTIFNSCRKQAALQDDQQSTNAFSPHDNKGVVFIETNAAPQNAIIAYSQKSNGTLTYLATTPTGGSGTGNVLGSQGALVLDEKHHWLFAVNAGSNTISSFAVDPEGALTLVSTVSSNGIMPVSLSVFGDWLYVVNSASGNISGFTIGTNGSLTLIAGSDQSLTSTTADPGQIQFTPDRHLIVTEKSTDKIMTFPVTTAGVAGPGLISEAAQPTPFGFGIAGNNIVVAHTSHGAANFSTVVTYKIPSYGNNNAPGGNALTTASAPISAGQTNASRVAATRDGKFAYVTNLGSNSISSFSVNINGSLQVVKNVEAITGTAPADIVFDNNENFLYTINTASHTISQYKKSPNGRLSSIGEMGGLPAYAAGLVAL
jgi:6-phosphogluconolactonase